MIFTLVVVFVAIAMPNIGIVYRVRKTALGNARVSSSANPSSSPSALSLRVFHPSPSPTPVLYAMLINECPSVMTKTLPTPGTQILHYVSLKPSIHSPSDYRTSGGGTSAPAMAISLLMPFAVSSSSRGRPSVT